MPLPTSLRPRSGPTHALRALLPRRVRSILALVLAVLLMLASLALPYAALLSAALAIFASVVQRWLFFAEAQHVSTLFYGAKAA